MVCYHSSPLTLVHHWHCCTVILFFYFLPSGICSSCYSSAELSFSSFITFPLASVHRVTALLHCHSLLLYPAIWHQFIVLQYSSAALSFSSLIPYHLVSFHRVTALLRCHSGFCSLQSGICSSCWSIAALSFWFLFPSSGICSSCYIITVLSFSSCIPCHLASVQRATALLHCHNVLLSLASSIRSSLYSIAALSFSSFVPCHLASVLHCHFVLLFPIIWHLFIQHCCTLILFVSIAIVYCTIQCISAWN